VRHIDEALVERREEHVLHPLGHPVQLVEQKHGALLHRPHQGPRTKRLGHVATLQDHRRVKLADEAGLGVAAVAVHPHEAAPEGLSDRPGDGRLAHADGAL
jgi:hypothetical protein